MKILGDDLFADLSQKAAANPRRRQHLNLHADYGEPCQRLLNAMEPGSYIRPHRHLTDPKVECFLGLRGRFALILFDDEGHLRQILRFGPLEENAGADLPPGVWHTVVSLESGSIFFETKPGPFNPLTKKDLAPWAPEEGSPEAAGYLQFLELAIKKSSC